MVVSHQAASLRVRWSDGQEILHCRQELLRLPRPGDTVTAVNLFLDARVKPGRDWKVGLEQSIAAKAWGQGLESPCAPARFLCAVGGSGIRGGRGLPSSHRGCGSRGERILPVQVSRLIAAGPPMIPTSSRCSRPHGSRSAGMPQVSSTATGCSAHTIWSLPILFTTLFCS